MYRNIIICLFLVVISCSGAVLAATDLQTPPSRPQVFLSGQANQSAISLPQPPQQKADIEAMKKEMAETFSSHVALMSYGFTALSVFVGMLALIGLFITFFSVRAYIAEIKEKKSKFEKYEQELKALLDTGKKHCESLSDMLEKQGNKEKFDQDIVATAKEKIANGTGVEVLWGEAILAQENEQWEKAHTFWTAILGSDPKNKSALFGAALACMKIYDSRGKQLEGLELLNEGKACLQRIPDSARTLASWNNLGKINIDIAKHQSRNSKKIEYINNAIECFERAIASNKNYSNKNYSKPWVNWGAALIELARISDDNDKKNMYLNLAEEKFLRVSKLKPKDPESWDNLGNIDLHRAGMVGNGPERMHYLNRAEKNLHHSLELDPKGVCSLYNLACSAALKSNVLECVQLMQKAHDGGALPSLPDIERDTDFDQVRHLKEFKDFIAKVEKEANSSS